MVNRLIKEIHICFSSDSVLQEELEMEQPFFILQLGTNHEKLQEIIPKLFSKKLTNAELVKFKKLLISEGLVKSIWEIIDNYIKECTEILGRIKNPYSNMILITLLENDMRLFQDRKESIN